MAFGAHRRFLRSNSLNTEHSSPTIALSQPKSSLLGPAGERRYYDEQHKACTYSKSAAVGANMKACEHAWKQLQCASTQNKTHQKKSKTGA